MPNDIYQQVFGLSMASNLLTAQTGDLAAFQLYAEKNIPLFLDKYGVQGWEVVWGPVVWMNAPTSSQQGADNTWYVANNPKATFADGEYNTYVIAIAGSQGVPSKSYDYVTEDSAVTEVVDFDKFAEGGLKSPDSGWHPLDKSPVIASGTAIGVSVLASNPPPSTAAASNILLGDFLESLPSDARVIFTGHSLGGALSPTLALGYLRYGTLGKFASGNVLTYPTAGPSPGNAAFTSLFTSSFPAINGDGYRTWNINVTNYYDAVPQAWCTKTGEKYPQNLFNIVPLFSPMPFWVKVKLDLAIGLAAKKPDLSGHVYIPLPRSTFMASPPAPIKTLADFGSDVHTEHISAYFDHFGFPVPPEYIRLETETREEVERAVAPWAVIGTLVRQVREVEESEASKALVAESVDVVAE